MSTNRLDTLWESVIFVGLQNVQSWYHILVLLFNVVTQLEWFHARETDILHNLGKICGPLLIRGAIRGISLGLCLGPCHTRHEQCVFFHHEVVALDDFQHHFNGHVLERCGIQHTLRILLNVREAQLAKLSSIVKEGFFVQEAGNLGIDNLGKVLCHNLLHIVHLELICSSQNEESLFVGDFQHTGVEILEKTEQNVVGNRLNANFFLFCLPHARSKHCPEKLGSRLEDEFVSVNLLPFLG
mmetsp:Transcript_10986/g.40910  ORF Transcript_10986/g.40910 Transcript_10986/m.40910 type:complete len:241 (-) Transcript_10986:822-1544(-)